MYETYIYTQIFIIELMLYQHNTPLLIPQLKK